MKIYLIKSTKGSIQIATSIYLHEGGHLDVFELSMEGYNRIKDNLQFMSYRYVYEDANNNKWYLRNNGINGEIGYKNGIANIEEFIINSEQDLYTILSNKNICAMNRVRLTEKWFEKGESK